MMNMLDFGFSDDEYVAMGTVKFAEFLFPRDLLFLYESICLRETISVVFVWSS